MVFVNKGFCENFIVMFWLRELFWFNVRYNFYIRMRYLVGINNVYADRLSYFI